MQRLTHRGAEIQILYELLEFPAQGFRCFLSEHMQAAVDVVPGAHRPLSRRRPRKRCSSSRRIRRGGPHQAYSAAAAKAAVKINRVRNVVMAVMANFLFAQLVNGSWGNLTTALDIVHGTSQHLKFFGNS